MSVDRHHQERTVAADSNHDRRNWGSRHTGPAPVVPQAFPEPNVSTYQPFLDVQQPAEILRESERPDRHNASLLARIETILGDRTEYRELLAQRGELAQSLLDLLKALYDYPGVLPKLRSKILHAIIRLSNVSGLYPDSLALDAYNVTKVGNHPVAAGGFGDIWKGLIGEQMVCLKVARICGDSDVQKLLKEFRREGQLWRQLHHPNILPCLGDSRICLISPWMEMGNLRQYLDKHGEGPIDYFALAFDIACGLSYLHGKKVVHGDLKGDNILITNLGRAAIADFGLARMVSKSDTLGPASLSMSYHVKGSTRWLAPECLLKNGAHTYHSDIYAFGCVCYEVFTRLIPFYEFSEISVVIHLNEGRRPSRRANSRLNDNMWAIMQECWRQEPDSRPPTNTLSGRIISAADRKTINLGRNWDDSLPSLLRRNMRYPELCPSGSLVDAFLFGPRYQSTNLLQHYMNIVCRMQYLLADMTRLPGIFHHSLRTQNVARDGAILLATIHCEGGQSALARQGHTKNRYNELVQTLKGFQGNYTALEAMAALHIISAFLFDGGQGEWGYWMDVAYIYCHSILDNKLLFLNSRDALLNCSEDENFIIKTVFWFDVLASVTTMKHPHFRDVIHEIYDPKPKSDIYDPDDDCNSDKLSMMTIMGCENRILWALSEISALACWRNEQSRRGRLNTTLFVHKADNLGRVLELSSQQQGTSESYSQPEEEARHLASEVFRTAAIVYLRTVVSNDFHHVEGIKSAVKDCIKTFMSFREHRTDVRHIVVRSTVFAVYLCGCFTDVPADLKVLKEYLQEEDTIGNCRAAMELMNVVRASRKPAEPVRWREALHDAKMLLV
ncbi:kinase-like protein [Dendrothele bispora CBS 962.96]|uniref:Kinase-like protein n=1 Tax=Dendrothele bispora (strain CBS 962.96) TaxID=1314807 RepID=A0A4S8LHX6_DENBC|nr:kinase-like protein [Dendrothele bispora CBS 962.96]